MWQIDFIKEEDFMNHVRDTIRHYGDKLLPYNIKKFNSNLIDPIKMIFDKEVYGQTWESIIASEIFRQRDKSAQNDIGYFHQRIFQYFEHCHVPNNGKEGGWDIIFHKDDGIILPDGDKVATVYVEMKNKHNTMNSSAAGKTYIKMQNQLLQDDDCICCLVEVIAKKSQDIKWETSVDGRKVSHKRIRRVSVDRFYAMVTGEEDAFFQICMALPDYVEKVLNMDGQLTTPRDTVISELLAEAEKLDIKDKEQAMRMSMYMLGFGTYTGFTHESTPT